MTSDCPNNASLPLLEPYRSGVYLIFDYPSEDTTGDHFRRGDNPIFNGNTFRASGSRQLDPKLLAFRLKEVSPVQSGGQLHLVDLRQETHLFLIQPVVMPSALAARAVSWYADKDWANVGRTPEWVDAAEQRKLSKIGGLKTARVFCLDPKNQDFASPTGYTDITVTSVLTEATFAQQLGPSLALDYLRLHLNDHCPPTDDMLAIFFSWCAKFGPNDWVHFHCHGGDGRTTTFMALYDMLSWSKAHGTANFPSMEQFAQRQLQIFSYDLNPAGCDPNQDWKCGLAMERWQKLNDIRNQIAAGTLQCGGDASQSTNDA